MYAVNLRAQKANTSMTFAGRCRAPTAHMVDSITMPVRVPTELKFFPRWETVMDRGSVMLFSPQGCGLPISHSRNCHPVTDAARKRPTRLLQGYLNLGIAFNDLTLNLWIHPYGPYDDAPFPNATPNATQYAVPIGTVENAPRNPLAVCPSLCRRKSNAASTQIQSPKTHPFHLPLHARSGFDATRDRCCPVDTITSSGFDVESSQYWWGGVSPISGRRLFIANGSCAFVSRRTSHTLPT